MIHLEEEMQPGGDSIQIGSGYWLTLKSKGAGGMGASGGEYSPVAFMSEVIQCFPTTAHFYAESDINMGNPRQII
ncbi:hypothetical protein ES707_15833 [subsurface metagenome]